MKQKNSWLLSLLVIIALTGFFFTGCKAKANDADIKAAVETELKKDPMSATMMVDVKDGVVTLSGNCMNDSCKEKCSKMAESVSGVKSVVNNCTVNMNMENMNTNMPMNNDSIKAKDELMTKNLFDLSKDIMTVKMGVDSGIIYLAGNLKKDRWEKLKADLSKLNPKGYDTSNLRIE